jgi:hypothetical protein
MRPDFKTLKSLNHESRQNPYCVPVTYLPPSYLILQLDENASVILQSACKLHSKTFAPTIKTNQSGIQNVKQIKG